MSKLQGGGGAGAPGGLQRGRVGRARAAWWLPHSHSRHHREKTRPLVPAVSHSGGRAKAKQALWVLGFHQFHAPQPPIHVPLALTWDPRSLVAQS